MVSCYAAVASGYTLVGGGIISPTSHKRARFQYWVNNGD